MKPTATIVVQADTPKPVQAAGADLQKDIPKISGVELPLKTDGKDVPGITLNIGKTETAIAANLMAPKLNPETYTNFTAMNSFRGTACGKRAAITPDVV